MGTISGSPQMFTPGVGATEAQQRTGAAIASSVFSAKSEYSLTLEDLVYRMIFSDAAQHTGVWICDSVAAGVALWEDTGNGERDEVLAFVRAAYLAVSAIELTLEPAETNKPNGTTWGVRNADGAYRQTEILYPASLPNESLFTQSIVEQMSPKYRKFDVQALIRIIGKAADDNATADLLRWTLVADQRLQIAYLFAASVDAALPDFIGQTLGGSALLSAAWEGHAYLNELANG